MMAHGGLCEKPTDPKVKAELDSKLAQMQAERTKQDQMWTTTTHTQPQPQTQLQPNTEKSTQPPMRR
jgi:hypothetical protein